jgi:hypothetical protein
MEAASPSEALVRSYIYDVKYQKMEIFISTAEGVLKPPNSKLF